MSLHCPHGGIHNALVHEHLIVVVVDELRILRVLVICPHHVEAVFGILVGQAIFERAYQVGHRRLVGVIEAG